MLLAEKEANILKSIWDELNLSLTVSGHPFHIFSVSTVEKNKPDSRNVVLRSLDKKNNSITFHTDKRSSKIKQFSNNKNVCALFYDQPNKIQIRIHGEINLVTNKDEINSKWSKLQYMSKLCYINKFSPGDLLSNPKEYVSENPPADLVDNGVENFAIVNININSFDWLNLHHQGHERLIIDFKNSGSKWVSP